MKDWITWSSLGFFAYMFGAIPFGVIVARRYGVDIFKVGSGNPGATNVWRSCGKKAGLLVFALDVIKGVLPVLLARAFDPRQEVWFAIGLIAVLGHCLSPFVGFKGGKGISTTLGAILAAAPLVALGGFALFLVALAITRYVSLASILGVTTAVILSATLPHQSKALIPFYGLLWLFIVIRHRANIKRLMNGTESKFSFSGKKAAAPAEEPAG